MLQFNTEADFFKSKNDLFCKQNCIYIYKLRTLLSVLIASLRVIIFFFNLNNASFHVWIICNMQVCLHKVQRASFLF